MVFFDLGMVNREVVDCGERFKKGEINFFKKENDEVFYVMIFIFCMISEMVDCEMSVIGC